VELSRKKEVAEQENLDSEGAQPPHGKDMVDRWVAEIDSWVNKVDRAMGKGKGRGTDGADPAGEKAGSPPEPAPRPAD
jgi:hypothetical protein